MLECDLGQLQPSSGATLAFSVKTEVTHLLEAHVICGEGPSFVHMHEQRDQVGGQVNAVRLDVPAIEQRSNGATIHFTSRG